MLAVSVIFLPLFVYAEPPEIERPVFAKAIPGGFIIYVDPIYEKGPVKNFINNKGGYVAYDFKSIPAIGVKGLPDAALEGLSHMPGVTRIWQDREVHAYLAESIPLINANAAGVDGANGTGINVCILDTGINAAHSAFGGRIIAWNDFVNGISAAYDDHGHGTHVAGIVAADGLYRGVARGAHLIAGKVLDNEGRGYTSDIIAGIEWCYSGTVKADIINMSLGGGRFPDACDDDPLAEASNIAVNRGVVVVAASGNNAWRDSMGSPACGSQVIAVGAVYDEHFTNQSWGCADLFCFIPLCEDTPATADTRACFSNGGPQLDVVAPGAEITSALGDDWGIKSGTSMAAPHVAGLAALILKQNPSLLPIQVRDLIRSNASSPRQHRCADGYCAGEYNTDGVPYIEDCYSCPTDCPQMTKGSPKKRWCCGDGYPDQGEPAEICPVDYGENFNHVYGYGRIDAKSTWEAALDYGKCSPELPCNDGDPCTQDSCMNGQCNYVTITICGLSDGCCPLGCTADQDCKQCSAFKEQCTTDADCCDGLTCHSKQKDCR